MAQLEEGITKSYREVFGRDPNQEEITFYVKEFGDDNVYDTKEEEDLEQRLYNAASVGRQNIVDARKADQSNQSDQSELTEDKTTSPPVLADTAGLQRLYQNILFREGDADGLTGYMDRPMEEVRQALITSPEARGPARIRQIYQGVLGRDATPDELAYYSTIGGVKDPDFDYEAAGIKGPVFGGVVSSAERQKLIDSLRGDQLQRFQTRLGLPASTPSGPIQPTTALDFSSFGATPATAGIARLKPTDTTGTMAGVFASPQFTSPYSIQTEQQELPKDTFTQLGDLFGEQFKADLRAEVAAEEAEGKRAGGIASLGYRRGGVVDENGIPRLFIGGLFKGIGRALKGITKIAPFVLPFIPGFQALSLPMQSLIAGGVGGFRDGKFDFKRALTSGLTTYGIGKLAQAAGTPVGPEGGGVSTPVETFPDGTIKTAVNPGVNDPGIVSAGAGTTTNFQLPDPTTGAPTVTTGMDNIAQGSIVRSVPPPPTNTSSFTRPMSTAGASTTPSGFGIDRLQAEAVGTGQRIGDTFSNIASGNVESGKLIAPTLTTVGGITATKAGDEYAKQQAEYKALTAADAAEKERKRRLALEAMRRNQFGYNEGGVSSLPARYLDGAGDGMSDSIRANIGGMQEARLADGEFVVPADVVADLGNGSSNAGAERLYSMMDRIRQARHGTTKQPPEVNVNKALPA